MTPQERATALATDLYQRGMYEDAWIEPIRVAIVEATNEEINRRRPIENRCAELETQLKAVTNELRRLQIEREERLAPSEKLSAEIEELIDAAATQTADSIDNVLRSILPPPVSVAPAVDESNKPGCTCCHVLLGGQHKPSCYRQGLVSKESLLPAPLTPTVPAGDCSFMPLGCAPHVCQLCDRPLDYHKHWIQRHERWAKEIG